MYGPTPVTALLFPLSDRKWWNHPHNERNHHFSSKQIDQMHADKDWPGAEKALLLAERLALSSPIASVCLPHPSERINGSIWPHHNHFPNNSLSKLFPIFRSNPAFDVGIPVWRANCCFAFVIPNARFHEKLTPGIPVLLPRFAIVSCFIGYLCEQRYEILPLE